MINELLFERMCLWLFVAIGISTISLAYSVFTENKVDIWLKSIVIFLIGITIVDRWHVLREAAEAHQVCEQTVKTGDE